MIEIQKGLFLKKTEKIINGKLYSFCELLSEEGYCFYDIETSENYNHNEESGEQLGMKPENELVYYRYMKMGISVSEWLIDKFNERFVSVPMKEGYEIV